MPTPPTAHRCAACEDRGWIVRADDRGVERATRCTCQAGRGVDRSLEAARIPIRYRHCTIQNFSAVNESLQRARLAAERFVSEFPQHSAGLLFSGPCGTGKTHLAVGVVAELVRRHRADALFVDCPLLIRQLQDSFATDELRRHDLLRAVEGADVVLLDDLGGSKASEWVRDTFAEIVNVRYNAARLTLVTTRYSDDPGAVADLTFEGQVGTAVRSRLYEMCKTYGFDAGDFRKNQRNANHY